MKTIDAKGMHFSTLNGLVRESGEQEIRIDGCIGQRYIGSGMSKKTLRIGGIAGNALGAYLDGGVIITDGNAQDAVGDTMNGGEIVVNGLVGDAVGYSMRGGKIFIRGNAGYRAGIHMKAYGEKSPTLVIGGCAGSFLGEYLAGGTIIVLGDGNKSGSAPVGYFCGTGMHGGRIFLRSDCAPTGLPAQINLARATDAELESIRSDVERWCSLFSRSSSELLNGTFWLLTPCSANPYKQLYTYA